MADGDVGIEAARLLGLTDPISKSTVRNALRTKRATTTDDRGLLLAAELRKHAGSYKAAGDLLRLAERFEAALRRDA